MQCFSQCPLYLCFWLYGCYNHLRYATKELLLCYIASGRWTVSHLCVHGLHALFMFACVWKRLVINETLFIRSYFLFSSSVMSYICICAKFCWMAFFWFHVREFTRHVSFVFKKSTWHSLLHVFLKDVSNDEWKGIRWGLLCYVPDADYLGLPCERCCASKECKLDARLQMQFWAASVLSFSLWTKRKHTSLDWASHEGIPCD